MCPVKMAIKSYIYTQETKDKSQFSLQMWERRPIAMQYANIDDCRFHLECIIFFQHHHYISSSSMFWKYLSWTFHNTCEFYRLEKETINFSFCRILHLFYHCIYSRLLWKDLLTENLGAWFLYFICFCSFSERHFGR